MSLKRNIDELLIDETLNASNSRKYVKFDENIKKHTLDSDEEDDDKDKYNILDDNDIEGEEDASANHQDGETRMTAFNMNEEMEMGHFDKDGHFIWKNEKEVRDNWLDNVDWHRVGAGANTNANLKDDGEEKGLADDSDEEEEEVAEHFDHIATYRKIVAFMKPKESINKALKRLGGDLSKLSSIERLRRKKAGTLQSDKDVTELTELANGILTHLGNMDVYQETYEQIMQKLNDYDKKNKSKARIVEADLDMYADDFDDREKSKHKTIDGDDDGIIENTKTSTSGVLMWEFKWNRDKDEIQGPFTTLQMNKWSEEGYFKMGVWVRKCGAEDNNFYSSNRIDFDLYL